MNRILLLVLFLGVQQLSLQAQSNLTDNILTVGEGFSRPTATVDEVAWITGEYECPAFGGTAHEVWTAPRGNNMMGAFQLIDAGTISFYEIMTIVEVKGSLVLRLKHFDSELHGWEEKDETIDFPLVKLNEKIAWFDGLTFEYVNKKEMNVYVAINHGEKIEEAKFAYRKVKRKKKRMR